MRKQFTVVLSYDTADEDGDPRGAVRTMLAAIETGNVYFEVFADGVKGSVVEGDLSEITGAAHD